MKLIKIMIVPLMVFASVSVNAQINGIDTIAVSILDRMSAFMQDMKSCTVTVKTEYDVANAELGLVKHTDDEKLYMSGGNKLFVSSVGDKGSHDFIYNGKTFTHYSANRNHYAQTDWSGTVVGMIDSMHKTYGIVFPAADFLYPAFVDDILAEAHSLALLGMTNVNGRDCYHIAGVSKDKTFQFWIADGPFCLPLKMVIVDRDKPMNPQFQAVYNDWQVNPSLPDALFDFHAPPNCRKVKLIPVNKKK